MRPSILDIVGPTQVFRNQAVAYTATASDPDGDRIVLSWTRTTTPCPTDPSLPANWPTESRVTTDSYATTAGALTPFCVWVFATDPHGAIAARALQVTPVNRAPMATIDVVSPVGAGPFSLYARLEFSGAGSRDDDSDPLTFTWGDVTASDGSHLALQTCADNAGAAFRCFAPGVAGTYTARLTVDDGLGGATVATKTFTVAEDQLPCLGVTNPPLDTLQVVRTAGVPDEADIASNANLFSVQSVIDDGDPFPGTSTGITQFSWFLGRDTDPVVYLGRNFPSYTLDTGAFTISDQARVRVEISDRNQAAVARVLLDCGDAPVCGVSPTCLQRMTWTVDFL
jgi:hypothetical protein